MDSSMRKGKIKIWYRGWFILFYDFPLLNSIIVYTFIAIMAKPSD